MYSLWYKPIPCYCAMLFCYSGAYNNVAITDENIGISYFGLGWGKTCQDAKKQYANMVDVFS